MGNFYMEATQINYRRDETLKTVDQKLQELSETSAIDTDIAPVFKSTNTYQPGDMVYYRNKLYVFNVEHTGAWAAADVTATDVSTELSSLKSGLINVEGWNKLIAFGQTDKASTLSFSGTAYGRSWICEIVVVGQSGITSPINVSTGGAIGTPVNLSETYLRVSENSYGISGSESANGTIRIGSGIGGNWGTIYVRSIHDHLKNATISIAYDS